MLTRLSPPERVTCCRVLLCIGGLLAALVCGPLAAEASAAAGGHELLRAAEASRTRFTAALEELAAWCDEQGLADQAQETRRLFAPRDPAKFYLPVLPEEVGRPELPPDSPSEIVEFDGRFARLRREQANILFGLAQRAVRADHVGLAYELAMAAIRANPDHEAVRRLLGYQQYNDRWRTGYEVRQLRAGRVWHPEFGWLARSRVPRYEQGQRFTGGRWVSAEEDARLHHNIENGWLIETEHYTVRSNHSVEAAVELGAKLERLHEIWGQIFARYYLSESQILAMFDGPGRGRQSQEPKYHVVFFRDRKDYVESLRRAMPNIAKSIGVYYSPNQTAYFFGGEGYEDRNLYHEGTHQLFHQSRPVARDVGERANMWIVEGIALYMESLRQEDGYYVLGGFDDQRMMAARHHVLAGDFYVPLEELTTFGMEKLQNDPRIAQLYSQAAGLTNFLVHYDGGRYRDALVSYLTEVYSGRANAGTLARLTDTTYGQLDQQYRQFVRASLPQEPDTSR